LLNNKKILITKNKSDAEKAFSCLYDYGVEIVYLPTIKIISRTESEEIKNILAKSYDYDYIIFTSGNAVEVFHQAVQKYNLDLSHCKIAVVGSSTAEKCRGLGFYVHIIPEEFSAKGLIRKFSFFDLNGKRILIPGSSLSSEDLRIGLAEFGANVTFLPIYDVADIDLNEIENELTNIKTIVPDVFVFTSPSSFQNFLKILNVVNIESYFENKIVCAIGTTTEEAIKENNVTVNIVPNVFSIDGVVDAIKEYYKLTNNIA
jgi:uroporphyrinogen-III synthase